jgi:hypothetical protein
MKGHIALGLPSSSLGCKFFNLPPLCVEDYDGRTYYVVHRLQSISRTTIHLGDHIHLIANGKCRESIKETKILIEQAMAHKLDLKIFAIF